MTVLVKAAVGLVAIVLLSVAPVRGQPGLPVGETEAVTAPDPIEPAAIEARLAEVTAERTAAENARAPDSGGTEDPHAQAVVARWVQVEDLLRQQLDLVQQTTETALTVDARTDDVPSVFVLNDLLEHQYDVERAGRQRKQRVEAQRTAVAAAKEKLAEVSRERRATKSELREVPDVETARRLELLEIDERVAREALHLRTIQLRRVEREESGRAPEEIERLVATLRERLLAGEGDDAAGFAALARREHELAREREDAARELARAELVLEAARARLSSSPGPDVGGARLAAAEAATAERDAIRQRLELLDARRDRIAQRREVWTRWSAVAAGGVPRAELEEWLDQARERQHLLGLDVAQRQGRLEDLERIQERVREQALAAGQDRVARAARESQLGAVDALLEAEREQSSALAAERRLMSRYIEDLEVQTGHVDLGDVVDDGVEAVSDLWTYEITAVEDSAITVGSVALACLLAGVGLWASGRASAAIGRLAQRRLRLDAGAGYALQTISFYVLFVSITLVVLRLVHFPLTVFTVLGGALAIGVGFGSQNVMNNFISGLILMFERPVRAGDLVEVEGNYGLVEAIGARSTRIRSTDGRHIIVPNSFFLENNVVNWTLSDELVRAKVVVGVIYGSPTRVVEKSILQAVSEEPAVLEHPSPIIIFDDFADSSLNFEVHFWVRARAPMQMKQVQSRVRFRIDDLFREHGLVIAFPQRDVHVDGVGPLQVEFVERRAPGDER